MAFKVAGVDSRATNEEAKHKILLYDFAQAVQLRLCQVADLQLW